MATSPCVKLPSPVAVPPDPLLTVSRYWFNAKFAIKFYAWVKVIVVEAAVAFATVAPVQPVKWYPVKAPAAIGTLVP